MNCETGHLAEATHILSLPDGQTRMVCEDCFNEHFPKPLCSVCHTGEPYKGFKCHACHLRRRKELRTGVAKPEPRGKKKRPFEQRKAPTPKPAPVPTRALRTLRELWED